MKEFLFFTTITAEAILGVSLILTLINPSFRIWPPPARKSWQYFFVWGLTIFSYIGVFVLGIIDWDSVVLNHWAHFPLGLFFVILGLVFIIWGVKTLGLHATQGLGGDLITEGPYIYSRNPQYVGDIAMLLGYALICNSKLAWITSLLGIVWFVLAPYTEEPWLREQLGAAYEEYCSRVPRFLSLRRRNDVS